MSPRERAIMAAAARLQEGFNLGKLKKPGRLPRTTEGAARLIISTPNILKELYLKTYDDQEANDLRERLKTAILEKAFLEGNIAERQEVLDGTVNLFRAGR